MTDPLIFALELSGFLYAFALIVACLDLIDHGVPLQGLFWRALPQPFMWLWQLSQWIGLFFGPTPKLTLKLSDPLLRPRRTRLQMQLGVTNED